MRNRERLIRKRRLRGASWAWLALVSVQVLMFQNCGRPSHSIAAHNPSNENSDPAQATNPPIAPSALQAAAVSSNQIGLIWSDNSDNEAGFKIERAAAAAGPFTLIATKDASITSHVDTGLAASTAYYYRVFAFNSAGDSVTAAANATTPAADTQAPSGLTASAVSAGQIDLSWTDNSNNETGFRIERAPAATGPYSVIATVAANLVTYSNSGLSAATTYYYRVYALRTGGQTGNSNTASATTFGTYSWLNSVILQPKCASCHTGNQAKGDYDVTSYAGTMKAVIAGRADLSLLYQELESGSMPKGMAKLNADQLSTVRTWINSGAANN